MSFTWDSFCSALFFQLGLGIFGQSFSWGGLGLHGPFQPLQPAGLTEFWQQSLAQL